MRAMSTCNAACMQPTSALGRELQAVKIGETLGVDLPEDHGHHVHAGVHTVDNHRSDVGKAQQFKGERESARWKGEWEGGRRLAGQGMRARGTRQERGVADLNEPSSMKTLVRCPVFESSDEAVLRRERSQSPLLLAISNVCGCDRPGRDRGGTWQGREGAE